MARARSFYFEYTYVNGECSVTGGYVYRGTGVPRLSGRYVFGDDCSGSVCTLTATTPGYWQSQPLLSAGGGLTTFGEDFEGELYLRRDRKPRTHTT